MAERRSQRDVHLEYTFDRLLVAKLEQVYQILVPDQVRVVSDRSKLIGAGDAARMFNSHIRDWINYYGRCYKSATLRHLDRILARWAHRKFKSLRRHRRQTADWIARAARRQPSLFAHWTLLQGRGWTMGAG